VERDLLPAAGKEITGVISKAMSSLKKESMGILLDAIHIHIGHILGSHTFLSMLS
jgi:hypothetical protein